MKKVMFAAAAAASMLALGAVESGVVGYMDTTMRQNYSLFVPQFDDVGEQGISIQKIVPNSTATGITLQTFTDRAACDVLYYWVSAPMASGTPGWYTTPIGIPGTMADKTFVKGEGFMIYLPTEGISLNVSGEVSLSEYTLENVRANYTLMGNIRPTAYSIQKIVPDSTASGITLQTFTDRAACDVLYYWVSAPMSGGTPGWYTTPIGIPGTMANKTFDPGEGFMIYLPSTVNVTFQAAE